MCLYLLLCFNFSGDEDESEKAEAIEGILSGLTDDLDLIQAFCRRVADRQKELSAQKADADAQKTDGATAADSVINLSEQLASITATNSEKFEAAKAKRDANRPDGDVKAAILAQYAEAVEVMNA